MTPNSRWNIVSLDHHHLLFAQGTDDDARNLDQKTSEYEYDLFGLLWKWNRRVEAIKLPLHANYDATNFCRRVPISSPAEVYQSSSWHPAKSMEGFFDVPIKHTMDKCKLLSSCFSAGDRCSKYFHGCWSCWWNPLLTLLLHRSSESPTFVTRVTVLPLDKESLQNGTGTMAACLWSLLTRKLKFW